MTDPVQANNAMNGVPTGEPQYEAQDVVDVMMNRTAADIYLACMSEWKKYTDNGWIPAYAKYFPVRPADLMHTIFKEGINALENDLQMEIRLAKEQDETENIYES